MAKTIQVNENTHRLIKEVSDKRLAEGHPAWSMAAMLAEYAIAINKKECKK